MPIDETDKKAVALFVKIAHEETDKIPSSFGGVVWFFKTVLSIIERFVAEAQNL